MQLSLIICYNIIIIIIIIDIVIMIIITMTRRLRVLCPGDTWVSRGAFSACLVINLFI